MNLLYLVQIRIIYNLIIDVWSKLLLFLILFNFSFQIIQHLYVMVLMICQQTRKTDVCQTFLFLAKGYQLLSRVNLTFRTHLVNLVFRKLFPLFWLNFCIRLLSRLISKDFHGIDSNQFPKMLIWSNVVKIFECFTQNAQVFSCGINIFVRVVNFCSCTDVLLLCSCLLNVAQISCLISDLCIY